MKAYSVLRPRLVLAALIRLSPSALVLLWPRLRPPVRNGIVRTAQLASKRPLERPLPYFPDHSRSPVARSKASCHLVCYLARA